MRADDETAAAPHPHPYELLDALVAHWGGRAHLALDLRRLAGGISPVQLHALSVLAGGDLRMRELARRLGLAASTVTRLVDRLEAAGLAERRSERPDRRTVLVGLTTGGREALDAVVTRLRSLAGDLLARLTPHEQRELLRLLAKLGDGLGPATPAPAV